MIKFKTRTFRRIDKKIESSFFIVLAVAVVSVFISYFVIKTNQDKTADLINKTNPTLLQINKLQLLVHNSAFYTTNAVYNYEQRFYLDSLQQLKNNDYTKIKSKILALNKVDNPDYIALNNCIVQYERVLKAENNLLYSLYAAIDNGDSSYFTYSKLELQQNILPLSNQISYQLKKISNRQASLLISIQDEMLYSYNWILIVVVGLSIMLLILMLNAAFIIKKQIVRPVLKVQNSLIQLGRGELPEINIETPDNAIGVMIKELKKSIGSLRKKAAFVEEVGKGNFYQEFEPLSDKDVQGKALIEMRNRLALSYESEKLRRWQHDGLVQLNEIMRTSNKDFTDLLEKIIETIVNHIKVDQAAIFLLHNEDMNDLHIQLGAYYNLNTKILNSKRYELKSSLIGRVLETKTTIVTNNTFDPYFTIEYPDGTESTNCNIVVIPLITSGTVVGAIQVAKLESFINEEIELLEKMAEPIAASLYNVRANLKTNQLLIESRKQAEELAYQEQELKKINNELIQKSELLEASEEELKYQQEELKKVNLILEEKAKLLEEKNNAIEEARKHITAKAQQLEQSNKYKSAFLANMSHELRTPLNSILILAKLLSEDKTNHLNEKQREHAQVIHKSGSDLLMLINDILDLSKIEAGKLDLQFEQLPVDEIMDDINSLFIELANENKINFKIETTINSKELITTDRIRTEQILKNLLSNAFKFTPANREVKLKFDFDTNKQNLIIQVSDSGIGIPLEKQSLIFDAFQQADGSTSRKFGGTGLGLAICKELTMMMGGKIELTSESGKGSCFKIILPQTNVDIIEKKNNESIVQREEIEIEPIIESKKNLVLIVEDDIVFASVLAEYCRRYDLEFIIAEDGEKAVELTKTYKPTSIILDLILPIINGWEYIDIIKSDEALRTIPIHVISAAEQSIQTENLNVESYYPKPVGKKELDTLFEIIKNSDYKHTNIAFIGNPNEIDNAIIKGFTDSNHQIKITFLEDASQSIKDSAIDFVIISSQYVINRAFLSKQIFENNELSHKPLVYFNDSVDECIREINTVLNKNDLPLSNSLQESELENDIVNEEILKFKSVLVVDDDVRNIYSLTSILEHEQMNIHTAFSGDEAIEKLKNNIIDIVLMDIMMPGKNGFDTMREIRGEGQFNELPIIAVTAKAMKGDKELCIEAGANDYLTKPINTELLIRKMKQQLNTIKNENA
jgi:signal transduction histidine kinase/CheY-like chemotaxis protein